MHPTVAIPGKRVAESVGDPIVAVDRHLRIVFANEAWRAHVERVFGRRARLGADLRELLGDHPIDRARVTRLCALALRGREPRFMGPFGGGTHLFELRASPLRAGRSEPVGALLVARRAGDLGDQSATLDALPSHVAIVNANGTIVSVNEAWIRFGRDNHAPPDERRWAVGASYVGVLDRAARTGDALAAELAVRMRLLLRGDLHRIEVEYPCHTPAGVHRWFVARATRCGAPDDTHLVVEHQDVTARVRGEAFERELVETEASRRKLVAVLESITDAFIAFDDAWRCVYLNERAERIVRKPREELLGRVVWESWPELEGTELASLLRRAASERIVIERELAHRVEGRWVRVVIRPGEGALSLYLDDVSDRRAAEIARRESELLLASVFDALPVGVWVVDRDGAVERRNPAGERMWEGAERLDVHASAPGSPRAREPVSPDEPALAGALSGDHSTVIVRLRTRGGTRSLMRSAVPLRDEVGDVSGAIVVDEDVTRLQDTEDALRRSLAAREEVLRVVSHDLRTPIQIVLMAASQLANSAASATDVVHRLGERAARAARAMQRLTDDLLDLESVEAGRLSIHVEPASAASLVEEAVDMLRAPARAAGIALSSQVDPGLPEIVVDRMRLLQVFSNLGGNAVKFTPAGGAVEVGARRGERGQVVFWVRDTGAGLSPDELARVFERFWKSASAERRGYGLGLAIARGIVEAHGGRISAESAPGRGSTFSFTVPVGARP